MLSAMWTMALMKWIGSNSVLISQQVYLPLTQSHTAPGLRIAGPYARWAWCYLPEAMPRTSRENPPPAVHGRHRKTTKLTPRSSENDEG